MGQAPSDARDGALPSDSATAPPPPPPPPLPSPPTASFEDLVAEATASTDDKNESLDDKARRALECPCVAELKKGPCGTQFSEAFVCFIKSIAEEKGSDCVSPFITLQNCIKANPDAFSKDVLEEESSEDEEIALDYKIRPPSFAREPRPKI